MFKKYTLVLVLLLIAVIAWIGGTLFFKTYEIDTIQMPLHTLHL